MADYTIDVQDLHKSFDDSPVLKGISFQVEKGQIFSLLGSNGAGKTTTIRILSTLLMQDRGSASICGFDTKTQGLQVRQSISLTGQYAALDEIMTGRENLMMIAKLRKIKDPHKITTGLLERFALTDAAEKKVAGYSGGMKRKLDIAMSLIGDPPVIFLDEPTTGIDPEGRIEVWDTIKKLSKKGRSILLTTQYLDEAEHLADRIAILHHGKIIVNDTLENLKKLFPPAKVEYVEKQLSLEDIFLAITTENKEE